MTTLLDDSRLLNSYIGANSFHYKWGGKNPENSQQVSVQKCKLLTVQADDLSLE